MTISLVGFTGFVGSNIYAEGRIDKVYNSKNIAEAYGTQPDLLIYAGMRAEKFLANNDPDADMKLVYQAEESINSIKPKKLVLISTIDVIRDTSGKDEDAAIDCDGLQTYGLNRYRLEQWARERYSDALIIRLPGLYGINLKKNFIYDYINIIPSMLNENKFTELSRRLPELEQYYILQPNGFYRCKMLNGEEKVYLQNVFKQLGFTALYFTDSRSVYQFYPLRRLWKDIQIALEYKLSLLHLATQPVSANEIYKYLTGEQFLNELAGQPPYYDYRTKHSLLFGGDSGYIMDRAEILEDIKRFVKSESL